MEIGRKCNIKVTFIKYSHKSLRKLIDFNIHMSKKFTDAM